MDDGWMDCLSYAHDITIWITRSSDLHSDNIITTTKYFYSDTFYKRAHPVWLPHKEWRDYLMLSTLSYTVRTTVTIHAITVSKNGVD